MRLRKKHWAIPEMQENVQVYFDGKKYKGHWKEVFGNENPIYIEIGSGKGAFTTELSKRNPDINYIMIEKETNAFVYACRKIKEEQLLNVRALPAEAEDLVEYFENGEVERIYINFCNPWPKPRHHKRRLTHPRLLEIYKEILKGKSEIYMKTDDLDLFDASLEYVSENGFEIIKADKDMKLENYPENIVTEYESKWRSQGIPIKYGVFRYSEEK